jgi:hypothetical protein
VTGVAMDPFSVVGLVGNIVQFIDFSCKIVSRSSEILSSATGEPDTHRVLRTVTTDLEKFSTNLTSATLPPSASKAERDIKLLATHCRREANSLISVLNKLQLPDDAGRLPSVYLAMKSLSKQKEINDMRERLADLKSELMLHILALIR